MLLYRLAGAKHRHEDFEEEAEGARISGGRWNSKGIPVIYASLNPGTAALELLVHVDWDLVPPMVWIEICVPSSVEYEERRIGDLPIDWSTYPGDRSLVDIGDDWFQRGETLMLIVPSVASALERNAIINPTHSDIEKCTMRVVGEFAYDPRILVKMRKRTR